MAGATNRQLKTAGIPKAAMTQIRVHAGGHLTLKSALDVAARHGIAIPDKAHAFMAARDLKDRKVALQAASARRGTNVTRAIGDASKVALAARKEAARQKSVSRPVDAAKGRGKSGAMGNTSGFKRTSDGLYEGKIGDTHVRVTRGTVGTNRYGDYSKAVEWKARANGRVIADGHGTMSGAIAQARRALGVDASVTGKAAA